MTEAPNYFRRRGQALIGNGGRAFFASALSLNSRIGGRIKAAVSCETEQRHWAESEEYAESSSLCNVM